MSRERQWFVRFTDVAFARLKPLPVFVHNHRQSRGTRQNLLQTTWLIAGPMQHRHHDRLYVRPYRKQAGYVIQTFSARSSDRNDVRCLYSIHV